MVLAETPSASEAAEQRRGRQRHARSLSAPPSSEQLKYSIPLLQTGSLLLGSAPRVALGR